jgi:hypothetical protein
LAGKTLFNTLFHCIIGVDMQNRKHVCVNKGLIKKLQNTRAGNILKTHACKLNDSKTYLTEIEKTMNVKQVSVKENGAISGNLIMLEFYEDGNKRPG